MSGGYCLPKTYVVQFQVAVTLPPASSFNVRKYIASMASLAGISGCAYTPSVVTANRVYETACTTPSAVIRATVDTLGTVETSSFSVDRRLLSTAGTANVVTEIRIAGDTTKATTVQQSITVSAVNTLLTTNSVGSTTTVSSPTLVEQSTGSAPPPVTAAPPPAPPATAAPPPAPPATAAPPPPATPAPQESGSNMVIIIGGVGVGVLVLVIGCISAVLCTSGKKAGNKKATSNRRATNPIPIPAAPAPPAPLPVQAAPQVPSSVKSRFNFNIPYHAPTAAIVCASPVQLQMQYPLQQIHIHRIQYQ